MNNLSAIQLKKVVAICLTAAGLAYSSVPAFAEDGFASHALVVPSRSSSSFSTISANSATASTGTAMPSESRSATSSSSGWGSSFSTASTEGETDSRIQRALDAGYGQSVARTETADGVEFVVDSIVLENTQMYADLRLKRPQEQEGTVAHPRISVSFDPDTTPDVVEAYSSASMPRYPLMLLGIARSLPMFSNPMTSVPIASASMTAASVGHSSGYSIPGQADEQGYYDIQFHSDMSNGIPASVRFTLDEVEISREETYTYTVAEWLENPVEGIHMTAELKPGELSLEVLTESDNNLNFYIPQSPDMLTENDYIWPDGNNRLYPISSGSSMTSDERFLYTMHWKLDAAGMDMPLTLLYHKKLAPIGQNLVIDVPIDPDKVIQPFFSENIDKSFPSAQGDIKINHVEASFMRVSIDYETLFASQEERLPYVIQAPESSVADSYEMPLALVKIEADGQELRPSSGSSSSSSSSREVKHSMSYTADFGIERLSISVLQEDGTYMEVIAYDL